MPLFHIFNIVFIATTQHALLLAIVLPSYLALLSGFTGWTFLDLIATVTFLFLLTVETLADEEQWRFQSKKYAVRGGSLKLGANDPDAEDINRGFLTRGLFRYSRHPNFWAEQSMWWTIYLFSVAATGEWQNWTMGGTIALTALFQVCGPFSFSCWAVLTNSRG